MPPNAGPPSGINAPNKPLPISSVTSLFNETDSETRRFRSTIGVASVRFTEKIWPVMLSISTALGRRTRHDDTRLRGDLLSQADGRTVQSAKYNPTIIVFWQSISSHYDARIAVRPCDWNARKLIAVEWNITRTTNLQRLKLLNYGDRTNIDGLLGGVNYVSQWII